jgi:DNA polymerase-3 subunit gamma/tau
MVEHLQYVASQEGIHADNDALNVIAQKSDGAMRDALSIFDQVASYTEGNITYQAVIDNLNVLDYDYYFRLTEALLTKQVREALLILNDILAKGFDGQNIISGLAGHLRDLLVCRDESTIVLFEVGASIRERYKEMAKRCPDKWLFAAIDLANRCDLDYRLSRNKRLLLELTLIQICLLGESQSEDSKKKLLTELPEYPATPAPQVAAQPVSQIAEPSLPAVAPPAPVKTEPARRIPSTSLKQMGKSNLQTQQTNTSNNAMRNSPFVEAELLKLWNEYAQGLTNAYLQATMTNCNPVLKDNHTFEVTVFGSMQQDELLNDPNLLPFLRTGLANDSVAMKVTVSDEAAPKIAYTPEEKYNYLLSVNNVIDKLKEEFNLKID